MATTKMKLVNDVGQGAAVAGRLSTVRKIEAIIGQFRRSIDKKRITCVASVFSSDWTHESFMKLCERWIYGAKNG